MDTRNKDSPIAYICSPYSGDTERNAEAARRYSRYATDQGYIALAPHLLLPQYMSEETERELAISTDLRLLGLCQEIWVFGDTVSEGMRREIAHAETAGIPVRYVKEEELDVRD